MDLRDYNIFLYNSDSLSEYENWPTPRVIMCDGPYGVRGFKGDLVDEFGLAEWYEPHIQKWSLLSTPGTTLWFWCTEQGWAMVHPVLIKNGWDFKACHIWDKGMSHVAGNVNTKTISHLPVVSEVCVQYTRRPEFKVGSSILSMKDWLRHEWKRTGLPWKKANEACGVKDAATRKYFTDSWLWYMPPADQFDRIAKYANKYGMEDGKPYFSVNGNTPLSLEEWAALKPIFNCPLGVTNVWQVPQLRNKERVKDGQKAVHLNQKPLNLIKQIIQMSSNDDDVVWDPFGGLFTSAIACFDLHRQCYTAEINSDVFPSACKRVEDYIFEKISNKELFDSID